MIFATDIDGTVLRSNGTPHPETIKAFKEARKKGHKVVIATGRALSRVSNVLNMLENEIDYLVCNNGSLVYDLANKEELYLNSVNPKYFESEFNFAKEHNVFFTMHTNKEAYSWPKNRNEENIFLDDELVNSIISFQQSNKNLPYIFNGEYITQLSVLASEEFCSKYFPLKQKKYKDINGVYLTNAVFLDVNPLNISKWSGLCFIADSLNQPYSNIVTFGDSGNDYEMLKRAKNNGYAMANSTKDLTEKIKPRIGDNNSDAIAKIVKSLI